MRYRGYPIEHLAEEATFLEAAYLLFEGEPPTAEQLRRWEDDVRMHTYVHTNVQKFLEGYPTDYFTVLFALGRLPGWIAQWEEHLSDPEQKISRPRQVYTGEPERPFVPLAKRG
jgi:citrate synthase